MNRIYRSIWSERAGTCIAVSELVTCHQARTSSLSVGKRARFALKGLVASVLLAFGTLVVANPGGGKVTSGSATIAGGAGSMAINQSSQNVAINWQSFSISAGESVVFVQPNGNAVALNRVLGVDPSSIFGTLT